MPANLTLMLKGARAYSSGAFSLGFRKAVRMQAQSTPTEYDYQINEKQITALIKISEQRSASGLSSTINKYILSTHGALSSTAESNCACQRQ